MTGFFNTLGLPITWTCHICKQERPDEFISVVVHDNSTDYDLPEGAWQSNVRYCNDNEDCAKKAADPDYPHHGQRKKKQR